MPYSLHIFLDQPLEVQENLTYRKYVPYSLHIFLDQPLEVQKNLTYEEKPLCVLGIKEQILRTKVFSMVKILWSNHGVKEAT